VGAGRTRLILAFDVMIAVGSGAINTEVGEMMLALCDRVAAFL